MDKSNQLKSFQGDLLAYQQTEYDSTAAYIIGNGLNLTVAGYFNQTDPVHFYTFESALNHFDLEIKAGFFRKGMFRGNMFIPVISEQSRFKWQLPLSDDGFSQGYLNEPLSRFNFAFAKDDPETRLNITVKRIVFKNLDHLNCDLEIEYPYINTTFSDINDFRIYGNKDIGFGKSGGVLPLTYRRQAIYKEFDISLSDVGAGRMCEQYAIGFRADIALGEDVSGGDGAPAMNLYSNVENSHLLGPCNQSVREISTPEIYANQGDFQMSDEGVGEDDGSSVAELVEAQNKAMQEQIALGEALMDALDSAVVEIPVEYEDIGSLFQDSSEMYAQLELATIPEMDEETVSIEPIIDFLEICLIFADEKQSRIIQNVIQAVRNARGSQIYSIYLDIKNGTLIKNIVNAQVDRLVVKLTEPITSTCDKAKRLVSEEILKLEPGTLGTFRTPRQQAGF